MSFSPITVKYNILDAVSWKLSPFVAMWLGMFPSLYDSVPQGFLWCDPGSSQQHWQCLETLGAQWVEAGDVTQWPHRPGRLLSWLPHSVSGTPGGMTE